uniref:Reverse transcriptase domain-containing protein n=1 Tax=Tanacetum cinerariifolium TaxID=118510 RepID=A0A6L2M605_TANCI|nr:reverse transcriptase domain-containing protein [Tanacetum cinerariifolium]
MSAMANTTPLVTSVTKPATNPRDADATPRVNIQEFCKEYYEEILPIIMDKVRRDRRKDVHTRLDFGEGYRRQSAFDRLSETYSPSTTKSRPRWTDSRDHPRGRSRPHRLDTSNDCPKDRERIRSVGESYDDSFSHSYHDGNRSRHMKRRRDNESPLSSVSKSDSSDGRYQKSRSKRHKSTDEDDLTRPWMCEEEDLFTPRIRNFESSRRTRMHNNVKTYDGTGPEDHVKIFQAAAQVERWAIPTWCHMFNSTLIGAARVWFDELPPESIDSYKDLKAAFLAYFMQQKKYVNDPVEIHNIKQKDGETIEDFMERFKVETGPMKGPLSTMEEMMIATTAFIREATPASKKKGHTPWKAHDRSKRQTSDKRSDFRGHSRDGRGSNRFTPITKTPKEILAAEAGKFQPPPPMVTPVEKRSSNKLSLSPCNGIIGRPGIREIQAVAVPSTAHGMLKFPVEEGIITIRSTILIPTECTSVITSSAVSKEERTRPDNFKVALHPDFPDQEVAIGGTSATISRNTGSTSERDIHLSGKRKRVRLLNVLRPYKQRLPPNTVGRTGRRENSFPHWTRGVLLHKNAFRPQECWRHIPAPMDKAFDSQIGRNIDVYVDDLVVKSYKEAEMLRDIDETFRTLRKISMKLNPKKCTFGVAEGVFLGYVVTPDGIKPCPDKTAVVLQLSSPRTIKEVRVSMGSWPCGPDDRKRSGPDANLLYKPRVTGPKLNYTPMEKLVLSLVFATKRLRRYFQAHPITIITDQPIKQIMSRPDVAGRPQKWSIMLGEHNITYRPRTSVKGQILADFLTEMPDENPQAAPVAELNKSCRHFSRMALNFAAANNEAEYEPLIAGLRIAAQMGVKNIHVSVDSKLVANQVLGTYVAKEENMVKYLDKVKSFVRGFTNFSISQAPRSKNKKADALSKIASTSFAHLSKQVPVEVLKDKSIKEKEVTTVVEEDGPTWMTPIVEYLKERTLPSDRKEARKLRIKARQEIHEGSCSMHAGPRSVVTKAIRLGYYWPTMHRDARDMIRKCNDCQIHRPITRSPQQPLTPITAPWPFYKWGIDIAGPFPEGPGEIVSDNDKQFNDNPFKDWCDKINITQRFASVKHPQSNGLVERANRSLGEGIKARLGEGNKNWVEELPNVLWAHRTMIKSSHGDTPFSLTYGTESVIPTEIGMPTYRQVIVYCSNDASQAVAGGKLGPKWEGPYEVTSAVHGRNNSSKDMEHLPILKDVTSKSRLTHGFQLRLGLANKVIHVFLSFLGHE